MIPSPTLFEGYRPSLATSPLHIPHTPEGGLPTPPYTPGNPLYSHPFAFLSRGIAHGHTFAPTTPAYTPEYAAITAPHASPPETSHSRIERAVLQGLFTDITLPELNLNTRAAWHRRLPPDRRVLIVLRCIKNCGFEHLGEFLAELFSPHDNPHDTHKRMLSAFLSKRSWPGSQPIDIIRLIYAHKASEIYLSTGQPAEVSFPSLPRHARPRSQRLLASLSPSDSPNSTRGDILDWALCQLVLPQVDSETGVLLQHQNGFSIHEGLVRWDTLLDWDAAKADEIIATQVCRALRLLRPGP